ncbi:MAG: DUF11 domain-containing protein [Bifidobacteriaceae bacterium]|jgi:uncharacterized repeat protein (TIGR01451 family)|nr:DUF11 domain-containing protein [Bifidobacteriaceae bacterium]
MSKSVRPIALVLGGALVMTLVVTNSRQVAEAAATAPFNARYTTNANGAILSIGNTLMSCQGSGDDICVRTRNGLAYDNNNFVMISVDMDDDPDTYSSSSSTLNLPDGAEVLFAGLYWGARLTAGSSGNPGDVDLADKMLFKVPGASDYEPITGTMIAYNTAQQGAYQAFEDVTEMVQDAGNGDYWGADVEHATGFDRYAGWALTIAYTAPGYPLRNLTVFDGFNTVGSGYPQTIQVSGFTAPLDGPVDAQLSMVVYEGDLAQTGDYTLLNDTQLATAVSPGSNFFDSINSLAGASVTTRNPAYQNMLGFDIKNLGASGVIPNGATQATFSFRSAGDVYYPGVLALAINLYAPDFTSSTKTAVNLSSSDGAKPGDTLQYLLTYTNTGQDPAAGSRSCDPLPSGVTYVPGSMVLLSGPGLSAPVPMPDDGSSFGSYDAAKRQVCVNLGRGATSAAGGTINVGDQTSFQFQVTVADDAGGTTVRNIAHLAYATGTTHVPAVFDTPPVLTPVSLKADVAITKVMAPDEAIAGQGSTTTLTVQNKGPNRATGVVVTDPLPADYTATAINWAVLPSGQTGTCPAPATGGQIVCGNLPDLTNGQSVRITVTGSTASSSLATTLSNVASVTSSSFDPDLTNNVASASVPMTHRADLKIIKTPSEATVTPGGKFTWTIKVTNECSSVSPTNPTGCLSDSTNVSISDVVPDTTKLVLLQVTGGTGGGGDQGDVPVTCPQILQSATAFTCSVNGDGRLRPGQSATVTAEAYIMGNLTPASGPVYNEATTLSATYDPIPGNDIVTASVMPGPAVNDVQLIKTGPATATAGRRVSYTVTAQNFGPSDASAVQVVDDLAAAGLTADSSTHVTSDRGTCTIASSKVTCDIATLPGPSAPGGAGGIATITVTGALVPADTAPGAVITNEASMTCGGSPCPQPPGPDPHPDSPSVPSTVGTLADLSVVKTSDKAGLSPSDPVTYTITVTNNGPSKATGVGLRDELPGGVALDTISVTGGVGGTCAPASAPVSATCSINDLAPGLTSVITVTGQVASTGTTSDVETATVYATTSDPDEDNNVATWTHGPGQADLSIAKASTWTAAGTTPGPVAGGSGSYTLTVTNNGPNNSERPVVTDTLPAGLTPVLPVGSGCVANGQTVTCDPGPGQGLPFPGTPLTYTIPVTISPDLEAHTPLVNTATVTATTDDPTDANNTATVTDVANAQTDLAVDYQIGYDVTGTFPNYTLVTTPPPGEYVGPGSIRWAEIRLTNNGISTARDIQILSNVAITAIPDQTSFPSWCKAVNQELVCSLNDFPDMTTLAPGVSIPFFIPFAITSDTPAGDFPDCGNQMQCPDTAGGWATVTTSTPDSNPNNNLDTAGLDIAAAQTDLLMTKTALTTIPNPDETTDPHDSYVAGEKFGYRIDLWVPATPGQDGDPDQMVADAAGVVLTDTVPKDFLITQVNPGQGSCDAITTPVASVKCDLGTVRASTSAANPQLVSVYVYGAISPDASAEISDDGGAINTAVATSTTINLTGGTTSVTATAATDVIQQGDLQLTKLADAPVSYAGANVGYTLTTLNNGPSDVDDAVIQDTLPLGLALDPALSPGCTVDHTDTGTGRQVVTCVPQLPDEPAGAIAANTSVNTRIVATTDPRDLRPYWCPGQDQVNGVQCPEVEPPDDETTEHPRDLVNEAEVTASATDTKPTNNTASVTTVMETLADIAVTASVGTDTPSAGSLLTYTLNGVNMGPSTLDYPVVESTFPPGFEVVEVAEPYMNCSTSHTGSGATAVYTVRCVGWKVTPIRDSFQPGITVPGTVTVRIPADTPAGAYTATAQAFSRVPAQCPDPAATGTCESNYANNAVSVTVNVVQVADTSIVKRLIEPTPVEVGREVVYELKAANAGPSTAQEVTISDTVPAGLTYVSGTVVGGAACASPEEIDEHNVVRCRAGSLEVGESATARLVFQVDSDFTGELCNAALVGSGALDHDATNNTSTACSTTVLPTADVGVEVTTSDSSVDSGDPVSFTAVVTNHGDWDTTGAVVRFTVPSQLSGVAVAPVGLSDGGSLAACTVEGAVFTCPIGDLADGETAEYRITGVAGGSAGTALVVRAAVTHDLPDPDDSNDTSEATVAIAGQESPTGSPSASASQPGPGPSASGSAPTGGSGGGDLVYTGANLALPGGIAGLMLLAGVALVAWRVRSRGGAGSREPRHRA